MPWSSRPVRCSRAWPTGSVCAAPCRPAAATASACRPPGFPPARLTCPKQRIACTPLGEVLRIAGTMEFRRPDAPLDPRRIPGDRRGGPAVPVRGRPGPPPRRVGRLATVHQRRAPPGRPDRPRRGCSPPAGTACGASCWARSPAGCWPRRSVTGRVPPRAGPAGPAAGEPAAEPVTHAVTRVPAVEDIGGTAASPGGRAVEKVRDGHQIRNRAEHLAVGVDLDPSGSTWTGSSTYSASAPSFRGGEVLAGVRRPAHTPEGVRRRVRDVLIVCCDGLTGFLEAVEATWPQTTVQTCTVPYAERRITPRLSLSRCRAGGIGRARSAYPYPVACWTVQSAAPPSAWWVGSSR